MIAKVAVLLAFACVVAAKAVPEAGAPIGFFGEAYHVGSPGSLAGHGYGHGYAPAYGGYGHGGYGHGHGYPVHDYGYGHHDYAPHAPYGYGSYGYGHGYAHGYGYPH